MTNQHIEKSISSSIEIEALPETIWQHITNVNIEQFSDPFLFKLLDIPKPIKADLILEGEGGSRIAYFDSGKRFLQKITVWKPLQEYSFSFNPEKGFKVFYFFDLSEGVFRMLSGSYFLIPTHKSVKLQLVSTYSIDKRLFFLFHIPVFTILKLFQRYLLRSIKKNAA